MFNEEFIGPVKVKDALFFGDHFAAKDMEFLQNNRVTNVINLCQKRVTNMWRHYGISYLSFSWSDKETFSIIDSNPESILYIIKHIKEVLNAGNAILVHSFNGMNRSVVVLTAFLMENYSWVASKAMDFLVLKKPNLKLKRGFFKQLKSFEDYLKKKGYDLSNSWTPKTVSSGASYEEVVLTNTYINSKMMKERRKPAKKNSGMDSTSKNVNWAKKVWNMIPNKRISRTRNTNTAKGRKPDLKEAPGGPGKVKSRQGLLDLYNPTGKKETVQLPPTAISGSKGVQGSKVKKQNFDLSGTGGSGNPTRTQRRELVNNFMLGPNPNPSNKTNNNSI